MQSGIHFDLKALEVFVVVVESGGMTAAGQRLGITQSSVSQTLSNLEQALNLQLLDRSQRPPMLTPGGRQFYNRARTLLGEARDLSQEFCKPRGEPIKHIRIALVDSLATSIGAGLLAAIRARTTNWSMVTGQSHQHADALLSRRVDIIVSDDPVEKSPLLYRQRILREPFVLVLPSNFKGSVHSLRNLLVGGDFIRYSNTTVIGRSIETQLEKWGIQPPLRLQLDNTFAIMSLIMANAGWTITTPLCLLQSGLTEDKKFSQAFRLFPIPGEEFFRELTMVARVDDLGLLPQQLAEDSMQLLKTSFLPIIEANVPWLLPSIVLG
ncbi:MULTISPECIES: LysR family transcriptional regulator [Paraburkholderia]|uniref:LysR family transcriptional regulator n=1 Tax=Paraburkholderia TaxID=1822464 RepID=UPI002255E3BB|nr:MULTISPECIES: LysR family transcriptional regulator [Paraburkholderia]MCX4161722.1 LysR family transcriptional regulator [Paraburkholderia megapolitana]MDN7157219.1 LysR family transcriptional regulator [Paraburkholderia sp. CHISQ3]MDQ6494264.1 LysR family transcriptional regulator [Paraburkholderia megapolitana]